MTRPRAVRSRRESSAGNPSDPPHNLTQDVPVRSAETPRPLLHLLHLLHLAFLHKRKRHVRPPEKRREEMKRQFPESPKEGGHAREEKPVSQRVGGRARPREGGGEGSAHVVDRLGK